MATGERAARGLRSLPLGVHEAIPFGLRRALRHRIGRFYAWEAGFDHHRVPSLRPGEVTGAPDFIGIGVQKAGTSWWYRLILRHPAASHRADIHKERHFFTRFGTESFTPSDVADYHGWFPHAPGTITGEWTPAYFDCPWAPFLAAEAAPKAKLLLILRDPIERFRSGLAHQTRHNGDHVGSHQMRAIERSLYADHLRRWQSQFGAEQMLVLQYEACATRPAEELARTYAFLGVDPEFVPPQLRTAINKTTTAKAGLPPDAVIRLREIVGPDVEAVAKLVPSLDLSLWPLATGT
jgi:Sulfotransferase domain